MAADSKTHIFVISDLHLGGAPASEGKPAFQMCTAEGRRQLARFIEWAAGRIGGGWDVQLVVAGDIVDFLAEEREGGFQAFTNDDAQATRKLGLILTDTAEVWTAFGSFVGRGGALTLMLGNHDLELSLPGPRRLLLGRLGPGRVEFIYDNQAFTFEDLVLIEHGNRYDDWNAVPHDDLRETRSRVSRGEAGTFDPLPGSRMVVELVNPTKKDLSFVDLLKPEDAALLPFLALLAPDRYQQISTTLKNRLRALRVSYGAGQQPKDRNFVGLDAAAPIAPGLGTGDADDDALMALAAEAAGGGDAAMVGGVGPFLERWKNKLAEAYREKQLDLLLKVLRAYRATNERAFNVTADEDKKYLTAATESAARGFEVVVYGHTHRPKRISLAGRQASNGALVGPNALYLNSGTWADLMVLPSDLLAAEDTESGQKARALLRRFADDLASNRLEGWRRQLPTFAAIDVESGRVTKADVEILEDGERPVAITTELVRARLERRAE